MLKGGFLHDTHSPTRMIVITGVRRGQGSARETLRRENPERGSRPGFLLSPILGSRPYGGVSGVPYSQRTNGSNTSVGGWGCRTVRLTAERYDRRHGHIPLSVRSNGPVLRFTVYGYGEPAQFSQIDTRGRSGSERDVHN